MKPVIPIALAFVVGLGGSTALGMRRPATPPDSTAATVHPATPSKAPAAPDTTSVVPPASDSTVAAPVATSIAPKVDPTVPSDTAAVAAQRLAIVFAKLSPQDVLPMAERMSDSALAPVLKRMGTSEAAAILAVLPPIRAKVLSRRLLAPTSPGSP